jgi:hypothetical protein
MIFQYEYFQDLMRNEWENITVGKKIPFYPVHFLSNGNFAHAWTPNFTKES